MRHLVRGQLYAVSGHSGAGKTSVMRCAMGTKKEVVSVTTRPIRERDGEIDGVDYYFMTQEEFDDLDANDMLAEKTTYYGRSSYGVTKAEIDNKLSKGNAFIIVDFNGYEQLKVIYPDLIGIFIYTSKETAHERMISRGDTEEYAEKRLETYDIEMANMKYYNFAIRNTDFFPTVSIIEKIVQV